MHIVTSKKKVDFLQPVITLLSDNADGPKITAHLRNKVIGGYPDRLAIYFIALICCYLKDDGDEENFKVVCAALQASHKVKLCLIGLLHHPVLIELSPTG